MSIEKHLFTSEAVTEGHPDKMADQISDAILDAYLRLDPNARVAAETFLTTGLVVVGGEITSSAHVDVTPIVRRVIEEIGYTSSEMGFCAENCAVMVALGKQSPDIDQGVSAGKGAEHQEEQGAGDQGHMFGYAVKETPALMPLSIQLAQRLAERLAFVRKSGLIPDLRPDGKTQVTLELDEKGRPRRIDSVVISAQHGPSWKHEDLAAALTESVIRAVCPEEYLAKTRFLINPTGRFVVGGPMGDAGLTGRKIIVDTYGGHGAHGGGAFSGKDPSKVDRSACYMARYVAKHLVAAGLVDRCLVQLAYAIGVAEPVGVFIESFGSERVSKAALVKLVRQVFPLKPKGMIEHLELRKPIYQKTACYGHFGREGFSWEQLRLLDTLKKAI